MFQAVIKFYAKKDQVPGALLEDLVMICKQYGLEVSTINLSAVGSEDEVDQPKLEKDPKTHEPRILQFPKDRWSPDGNPV